MNDRGRVAVIFGRRHDAVFAVAGVKDRDADHQGGGEFSRERDCQRSVLESRRQLDASHRAATMRLPAKPDSSDRRGRSRRRVRVVLVDVIRLAARAVEWSPRAMEQLARLSMAASARVFSGLR